MSHENRKPIGGTFKIYTTVESTHKSYMWVTVISGIIYHATEDEISKAEKEIRKHNYEMLRM